MDETAERATRATICPVCHWKVYKDRPGPDGKIMDHGHGEPCAGVEISNPNYWRSWEKGSDAATGVHQP